jgi:hypothetical protein
MTGRHYTVDGKRLPSVTTILTALANEGITAWKIRVGLAEAQRISKEATDYGTAVHLLFERINRGNRGPFGEPDDTVIAPYVAWYDVNVHSVIGAERLLVSRKHGFAGTTDLLAVLDDGKPAILDLKTSKTPLGILEWRLQTAAYTLAAAEDDIHCERRVILRMPKAEPGKLYVHELDENTLEIDQRAFLAVLRIYKWHVEAKEQTKKTEGMRIRFGGKLVQ